MLCRLPFPDERFARDKPPFLCLPDANLILLLEVCKKGDLAEQGQHCLAVRHSCDGAQNRFKY